MRIQQVTAAVTRHLIQTGTRAINRVDALLHAGTDLHLYLACVSPGLGSCVLLMPNEWQEERMPSSPPVNSASSGRPGFVALPKFGKADGKLKRLRRDLPSQDRSLRHDRDRATWSISS